MASLNTLKKYDVIEVDMGFIATFSQSQITLTANHPTRLVYPNHGPARPARQTYTINNLSNFEVVYDSFPELKEARKDLKEMLVSAFFSKSDDPKFNNIPTVTIKPQVSRQVVLSTFSAELAEMYNEDDPDGAIEPYIIVCGLSDFLTQGRDISAKYTTQLPYAAINGAKKPGNMHKWLQWHVCGQVQEMPLKWWKAPFMSDKRSNNWTFLTNY